ncbi:Cytochrome c556 [Modicisalibacter ilicicola DSM 19980]|uniref:Cytochrome c556 n=1 Tax=Modicisalibacter ilicicola DSM 19980 TaxID=1121942 RepID=A0A1M4XJ96_9GAMM|nr:cytochrome c [Halomonas ilicicola]SHE93480.1 Cytochrome c556 [Halomonas ilicicola DSM 19980]
MKSLMRLGVVTSLLVASTIALAADEKQIKDAIEYRQAALHTMGWNFGPLGAMAKGDLEYDAQEAMMRAERVAMLAKLPWEGFIEGSLRDAGHGVDTDALAKIADNREDFDSLQRDMEEATSRLAEVAQQEDFPALRKQVAATGDTCKECHDEYRAEN